MKRFALFTLCALLPLAAFTGIRDEYAQQWPLTLASDQAGAYRVVLDQSVYRQLQSPSLDDLDVVNAQGVAVAASLFDPDQPLAQAASRVAVPWFALPDSRNLQTQDIASISEIATDGSLRRVTLQPGSDSGAGAEYLIDTSALEGAVQALQLGWADADAPLDSAYRVLASDDLRRWRTVQEEGRLVQLQNNGQRVLRNRIELEPITAKYLRLVPHAGTARPLQISSVLAELAPAPGEQAWQWQEVQGTRVLAADGSAAFEYAINGRFPFERADVLLPGNAGNEWMLQSRDAADTDWRTAAAPWVAFQLEGSAGPSRSPAQTLRGLNRDHFWRLQSRSGPDEVAPTLRLGYRPEVVVFLAQGQAPFALVAGSGRAARADAPLPQLVDALRAQRGHEWQPGTATLGAMQPLAGAAALTPEPVPRDWKAWLLWALLIGGALIVAGFALSLLKQPAGKQGQ